MTKSKRLIETEAVLARTDRLWRAEMKRDYGPDGVLHHGFGSKACGRAGTKLRQTYDARRAAITAWRRERQATE